MSRLRTLFQRANEIKDGRRQCREFYSRNVSSRVSHYVVPRLRLIWAFPANTITVMMALFAIVGSTVLVTADSVLAWLLAWLCYICVNVCDTSDGEIARWSGTTSRLGVFLDVVVQAISDAVVAGAFAVRVAVDKGSALYACPWICLAMVLLLDRIAKQGYLCVGSDEGVSVQDVGHRSDRATHLFVHVLFSNTGMYHLGVPIFLLGYIVAGPVGGGGGAVLLLSCIVSRSSRRFCLTCFRNQQAIEGY